MKKNRKANKILVFFVLWLLLVFLYPFHSESGIYQPKNQVKCKNCQKTIHGRIIQVHKYNYHPECFICEKCGKTLSGEFVEDGIKKYHPICYKMAKGCFLQKTIVINLLKDSL